MATHSVSDFIVGQDEDISGNRHRSPQSPTQPQGGAFDSGADDGDEYDDLYGDQDDARSFLQPAISPVATRLTSPRTPAAEKAAAMYEGFMAGPDAFLGPKVSHTAASSVEGVHPDHPSKSARGLLPPGKLEKLGEGVVLRPLDMSPSPNQQAEVPSASPAGGLKFQASTTLPNSVRTSPSTTAFGQPKQGHGRSSSVGSDALKRLSRALPSISLPGGFFSSMSQKMALQNMPARTAPEQTSSENTPVRKETALGSRQLSLTPPGRYQSPSVAPRRSLALRRSMSDESLLYHSMSRASSLAEDRFEKTRDQGNTRFRAIMDSFPDVPSFKMPQLPNLFAPPNKSSSSTPGPDLPSFASKLRSASRDSASSLDLVLKSLVGDIVLLGGYRGSILRDAKPPHRQLWVPVKVGLNIRKVNLEIGLDPEDEENSESTVFASGMLQNIGPVDISRRLFKKLRECENARTWKLRVHDYGYDWRLSPHILSQKLIAFLEKLPANQVGQPQRSRGALVIAHSLGGLITRHAVNQRPELFSGVIYAGTPQRCINILGPIRNSDAVLLNKDLLTPKVTLSLRSTFIFLPEDGFCFIDKDTREEYKVDFYNIDDWIKYRLSPCVEPTLPPFNPKRPSTFGSLLDFSSSLSSLPLLSRSTSDLKKAPPTPPLDHEATLHPETLKNRTALAPQLDPSSTPSNPSNPLPTSPPWPTCAKTLAYLTRTLAATKRFRAETAHVAAHAAANAYPPLAVVYGRDTPTVRAARVRGRAAIACADAYDDLAFAAGDGVVLAREALPPPGYGLVRGGLVCADRGHVTLLGDLGAVGRALEAVVRGRGKGIGLGGVAGELKEGR